MSGELIAATRTCPVCGERSQQRARYCWNCGARFPASLAPGDRFSTVATVVPGIVTASSSSAPRSFDLEADDSWDDATTAVDSRANASAVDERERTASAGARADGIGAAPESARTGQVSAELKDTSRTVWIVLGVFLAITLFCCVVVALLVLVARNDTMFQDQLSLYSSTLGLRR